MTMTIDANQQRFPLTLDHMSSYAATSQPQFSNPWVASSPATSQAGSHGMFVGAHGGLNPNPLSLDTLKHPQQPPQQRAGTGPGGGVSMARDDHNGAVRHMEGGQGRWSRPAHHTRPSGVRPRTGAGVVPGRRRRAATPPPS